jgi:RHS repeat-associated protein
MGAPYTYTQEAGTLDVSFEGEHVVLQPGDAKTFPDACSFVRFVNTAVDSGLAFDDQTSEGIEALRQECIASGGGPGGAPPPPDPPPTPPPSTDPASTDGGPPADRQPETSQSLGAPAPAPAGQTSSAPRAPGSSDGRPLSQQYYDARDPLPDYDLPPLLLDGGVAPDDLDRALEQIEHNEPADDEAHHDFGNGDKADPDTVAEPVVIFSGNFVISATDIDIVSRGFNLQFVRHYQSGPVYFGPWGYNWDHNYNVYLRELSGGRIAIWTGELREDVYTPRAGGGFEPPVDGRQRLEFLPAAGLLPDRYLLTDRDGFERMFTRPAGYPRPDRIPLVQIADRHGNTHELTYDAEGQPVRVVDHAGREIVLEYGDCGLLERARDQNGRTWQYYHDDEIEHLVAVISPSTAEFPEGVITQYEYGDRFREHPALRHSLTRVIDPDGRELVENQYGDDPSSDDFGRVVRQNVGGYTTLFAATRLQFVPRTPDALNVPALRVEVDDPGTLYVYTFNYRGDLLDERVRLASDGSFRLLARTYRYDQAGNMSERYEPNGFGALMTYDAAAGDPRARSNLLRLELVAPPTAPSPSRIVRRFTYEPSFHRVKTSRDELGHQTTFIYDYEELAGTTGDVIRIEYPVATLADGTAQTRQERFTYNQFGQMTEYRTGAGHRHGFEYESAAGPDEGHLHALIQDIDGVAVRLQFEYNGWGQQTAFIDGRGNRIENDIDHLGYLTAVRHPAINGDRAETRYFYFPSGRLRREEVPRGTYADPIIADPFIAHEYQYDVFGTLSLARYGVNTATPLEYAYERDPLGNIRSIRDPLGRRTLLSYDERAQAITKTEAAGLPEEAIWRYLYDANGNQRAVIDPAGHRVDYAYDAWDRLRLMTLHGAPDAERTRIAFSLNASDKVERIKIDGLRAPGVVDTLFDASTTYDERARPLTRQFGQRTLTYQYDADERVVVQADQRGATTIFAYDGLDRITSATDALGNEYRRTFDAAGNLITHEQREPSAAGPVDIFTTTISYDSRNRPTTVTDPLGRVTSLDFDARNLRVGDTDPLGRVTRRTYGIRGELSSISRELAPGVTATNAMTYDSGGRMIGYQDPEGAITTYEFDARDRRTSITYPNGALHQFVYGARIQPLSETSPGGTQREYRYRPDGALARVDFIPAPGIAATPSLEIFADGLRRPVQLTQGPESIERTYDALRLIAEQTSAGSVSIDYDDLTGVARLTYPDLRVDQIETDPLWRFQRWQLQTPGSAALTAGLAGGTQLAGYTYRGTARLAGRALWNGGGTQVHYDGGARLTGIDHLDSGGNRQVALRYVYDAADRRRIIWSEPAPAQAERVDYDNLDRLQAVGRLPLAEPGTTLDQAAADALISGAAALASNETEEYQVNLADARTRAVIDDGTGPVTSDYALDANYEIVTIDVSGPPPTSTAYAYDADGRLVQDEHYHYTYDALGRLVEARELASSTVVLTQQFDPVGRVVRRVENGTETIRAHFGRRLVQENDAGGTPIRQYTYGPGIDELIGIHDGQNRLPLQDALQTVLAVTDAGGAVVERYRYQAFGAASIFAADGITPRGSSTIGAAPMFAGHPLLQIGRYDARARVYDPTTGRFLQPDPFDYVDSSDRYGYAHQDPMNWVDPDGEIALLIGLAVAAGVGLLVGAGTNAIRQGIQIHEGSRDEFSWSELFFSGATGAVLGPALVLAPELAIPLAGMGVASSIDQFEQGNWETGSFDLATAILPFGSSKVRSASFGRGTVFSPARGLGPIDPFSTRWGRIGTIGQEFLNPTEGVTRATHLTTDQGLQSIKTSNTINPTRGATGLKGLVEGSREGSWHLPWRASQLRTWSRAMTGLPFRKPYIEFDVRPGELTRPGGVKSLFSRYQRQIAGPIDLTGRNPTFGNLPRFGSLPVEPPAPALVDVAPWMHLPLPGNPFGWGQQPLTSDGLAQPKKDK